MKTLKFLFWTIVVFGIVFSVLVYVKADAMIEKAIEEQGSRALGAQVSVDDVEIVPFKEEVVVKNLRVHNLPGYTVAEAFVVDEARMKISLATIFSHQVVIRDIAVPNAKINLEIKGNRNNIKDLINNVKAVKGKSDAASHAEHQHKGPPSRQIIIEHLAIDSIDLKVLTAGLLEAGVSLPRVVIRDIGKQGGNAVPDILDLMLQALYTNTIKVNIENTSVNFTDTIKNVSDGLKKSFDDLIK